MNQLFYRETGQGSPLLILHGLFGTSDNWHNVARVLAQGNRKVILADLRNHGLSFHDNEFTYEAMANDVARLINTLQIAPVDLIGHSMGGKVAMQLAIDHPGLIQNLIVADIAPKPYPVHHHQIIQGLKAIPVGALNNRKEADDKLAQYVQEAGVRQFLLKNLTRAKSGGYAWKMNLPVISEQIENVGAAMPDGLTVDLPTLFIRGGKSDYIRDEDEGHISRLFSNYQIHTLAGAGHWVHAEQPQAFISAVTKFLNQ